jgi:hypothetical protein
VLSSFLAAAREEGDKQDLTTIIRPMERAAGVTVGGP